MKDQNNALKPASTRTMLRSILVLALVATLAFPPILIADEPAKTTPPVTAKEQPKSPADKPAPSKETLIKKRKPKEPPATPNGSEELPLTPDEGKSPPKKSDETPKSEKPAPAKTPARPEPTKPGPDPAAKKPAPEDELLLKSLDPNRDKSEDDDVERLERAIAGMREAQQRVEGKDAGRGTQDIQTRVVKDLDAIIEALQKPQSPPPNQNQDQQQKQDQQKQNQKQQSGRKKRKLSLKGRRELVQRQMQKQQGKGNEKQQPSQRDREKSPETSENQRMKKTEKTEQDRQQELVKDVWGHLPPNVRAELLNVFSEKYLPKYEELVRRYYEALAEKNRTRNPGR